VGLRPGSQAIWADLAPSKARALDGGVVGYSALPGALWEPCAPALMVPELFEEVGSQAGGTRLVFYQPVDLSPASGFSSDPYAAESARLRAVIGLFLNSLLSQRVEHNPLPPYLPRARSASRYAVMANADARFVRSQGSGGELSLVVSAYVLVDGLPRQCLGTWGLRRTWANIRDPEFSRWRDRCRKIDA